MWVRSQSKKVLLNVNQVVINKTKDESEYCIHGYSERGIDILGFYSTEEKALKVLYEIQDAIEDTGFYRIDNIGHGTYAFSKGVLVYQMPQDEDVIV